jgi:hypothetical protein
MVIKKTLQGNSPNRNLGALVLVATVKAILILTNGYESVSS